MRWHFEKSKSMPARRNSSASMGMSKWFELNPAKSHPRNSSQSLAAISLNNGFPATSASLMPVSAVTSAGMGLPGFTIRLTRFSCPSGLTFM